MKKILLLTAFILWYPLTQAQDISQIVRGKITNKIMGTLLEGASIKIVNESVDRGAASDSSGNFSIQIPTGRYQITVSFTGYATVTDELLIIAGRETVFNAALSPTSSVLNEVQVVASPSGEGSVPGLTSLSIEKTIRIPANFFDPVRAITSYPGIVAASDQNNSIIVRGNSPNGLLWRLNGLDIVNPNHLANAGTLSDKPASNGGGVNILSSQMLDRTNFYMGAFPARYGNALSGVIDMGLREGNKEKNEYTAQASLIGLDVAAEGPMNKKHNSSFLANYRYSTVGLLSQLGVNFGDEAISFQDFSFHLNFDQKNGGQFSLFGFWGNSKNDFKAKDSSEWLEDKDRNTILYKSNTRAVGLNYQTHLGTGQLFFGLAYSGFNQERDLQASLKIPADEYHVMQDYFEADRSLVSGNVRYETKAGEKGFWEVGLMTNYQKDNIDFRKSLGCSLCGSINNEFLKGSGAGLLLQPFTNFRFQLASKLGIKAGIRYLNYTYNQSSSVEPRISLNFAPGSNSSLDFSYGLVSQLQLPVTYFVTGNKNLGFSKAHHIDIGYKQKLSTTLKLTGDLFYQNLFNVPIEQIPVSTFSTINLIEGFAPQNLTNLGTGENYGVNVLIEKSFIGNHYFFAGGSYYESKYTGANGVKRNSRFNGNYTVNAVYGKEWTNQSKNRTIGLNTRLLYLGGLRESAINITDSQTAAETIYDTTDPYKNKLKDYFRIDLRLSFRKNKPGYTRTFAIDIQNVLNQQNESYNYYDFTKQKIITKYQLGIIPILVYRIDF